jgi:hypothetical protein
MRKFLNELKSSGFVKQLYKTINEAARGVSDQCRT